MVIRALVFDFDGLILETEVPVFRAWQETYVEYGQELPEDLWAGMVGTVSTMPGAFDPYLYLKERVVSVPDYATLRERHRERSLLLIADLLVLPGIEACLNAAQERGLRLGLASSSDRPWVTGHLERLGLLGHFECIRTREDVPYVKPDPALYTAVLKELDVAPAAAVAFEDSHNGVLAAKRAGMWCVAVPNPLTASLPLAHADLRLESLADLPLNQILARFEANPGINGG